MYPYLEPEDIPAALSYAAWRLEETEQPFIVLDLQKERVRLLPLQK